MNSKSRSFQMSVIVAGACLWLASAIYLLLNYSLQDELIILALLPVTIFGGLLVNTFQLPSGLKFTKEKITFTLSDVFILLVAFRYGLAPAVFIAGIESFLSIRRTKSKMLTTLFSAGMMSLSVGASALVLGALLRHGFAAFGDQGGELTIVHVAVAMLVASLVQTAVNIALYSTILSLRHNNSFIHYAKGFLAVAATFLVNGTIATLLHVVLAYSPVVAIILGAPVLAALYLAQRQQRDSVQQRITMMEKAHRETIEALAVTINAKDEVTHEHVLRVQIYATGVARLLECAPIEIEALKAGALLHDIGKIAVPDYILNKPGKLTADEFDKMKSHTVVGAKILGRVEFPYPVVPIVRSHHERWDGKGYPDGLAGEDIPMTARILSVVDCFDAVREDRPYRRGMTRDEAVELLLQGSGTQYDPRVVGTFVTHLPEFEAEVLAHRNVPVPDFGIEPSEELSQAAKDVAPAAGLAEPVADEKAPSLPQLKHKDLQSLYTLAGKLNGSRDRAEIIAACESILTELLPGETLTLTLSDHTGGFRTALAAGECAAHLRNRSVGVGEGVTGWVLANRRAFLNAKPTLDVPAAAEEAFREYKTLAAYPVHKGKELHGALTLYSRSMSEYTHEHERLMSEAATLIAVALSALDPNAPVPPVAAPEPAPVTYPDAPVGEAIESGMTH